MLTELGHEVLVANPRKEAQADPGEQHNRWNEEPEVVARLSAELAAIRATGRSR